jgi:hypothetical protein
MWLYFRFSLSLRDVEELLAERGVMVTYEQSGPGARSSPVLTPRDYVGAVHASVTNGIWTSWCSIGVTKSRPKLSCGGCFPTRSIAATRGSTIERRTHTSRLGNENERCGGSSRLSKRSGFSSRSVPSVITSAPVAIATLRRLDDNSWRNGAVHGERWSA